MYTHVCVYSLTCRRLGSKNAFIYTYICIHVHICVYIVVRMYVCVYIRIYVYIPKHQECIHIPVRAKERTLEKWHLLGEISRRGEISKSTSTKLTNP